MSVSPPAGEGHAVARPAASAPTTADPPRRGITATVIAVVSIIAFESMSISTVMPAVAQDLGSQSRYGLAFSLLFTAQLLGIVMAPPWIARAGAWPACLAGQALFAAGSALAGGAQAFWMLLAGRLVAGLGAGLLVVSLYVIIGAVYPPAQRPRVFAWVSAAWVLPSVVGPLLAAWLTVSLSWRAVFLVVLPATAWTTWTMIAQRQVLSQQAPRAGPHARPPSQRRAALLGAMVSLGAGAFQWGSTQPPPPHLGPLAVAAAGLAAMALAAPRLVPAGAILLRRGLPSVMAARFLLAGAMNGAVTFIPLMLVDVRGMPLATAGALLALVSLGWAGGAWVQGRARYFGRGSDLVAIGGALVSASLAGMAAIALSDAPSVTVAPAMVVCGLGMGLSMSSMSVLTLTLSAPADHASASSAMQLSDVLGSVVGISCSGALYAALGRGGTADVPVYALMWALAGAAAVVGAVAGRRTRQPAEAAGP